MHQIHGAAGDHFAGLRTGKDVGKGYLISDLDKLNLTDRFKVADESYFEPRAQAQIGCIIEG